MPRFSKKLFITLLLFLAFILAFLAFTTSKKQVGIDVLETYNLPAFLTSYREPGFENTLTPKRNPFGGGYFEYTKITAGYLDPEYEKMFGRKHYAIDLAPNETYFNESAAHKRAGGYIPIFATHNGKVEYLNELGHGNFVVITNLVGTTRTIYAHLNASYIKTGQSVVAGQPIGVMGSTGYSTGPHLHYAVQEKNAEGKWVYVNPRFFIVE